MKLKDYLDLHVGILSFIFFNKFFSSLDLDYFCCLKIVEILKETEKESKNMFGMYSSQRMKVFYQISDFYFLFSNIHLGLENNCFKL